MPGSKMATAKDDMISWVKIYTKDLFSYTLSKVERREIAEDLVQDTFLSAYQSFTNFKGKSNAKTWLFSILKNKIADHYRSRYKRSMEASPVFIDAFFDENDRWKPEYKPTAWANETELLDDPEFSKTLNNCIENLPAKWSSAVQLKYLKDHDTHIICSELEITPSNFWQIIHRAKLQLRNCLELQWFKK
ncbi:MAG: sigma-70 family RNA polymerase sigma factor [Ginsengibacter sp.]